MLSRASFLSAQNGRLLTLLNNRGVQANITTTSALAVKEGPERDLANFPRPVRAEHSGQVRLGFIPEEWFQFFYKKTGVTGPYVFGTGLITYLCSKEIYVMEHEYYTGLSILIMVVLAHQKFGKQIAAYLDKEIDTVEADANKGREDSIKDLAQTIEDEKTEQFRAEGQMLLYQAKRENVAIQLEAAYRERLMNVYQEVKRRLDYQTERQNIERRISQKHMVNWVVNSVLKSFTPEQEKDTLTKCINELGLLATAKK